MKETKCIKCNKELWLRDEDAGTIKEELRLCDECIKLKTMTAKEEKIREAWGIHYGHGVDENGYRSYTEFDKHHLGQWDDNYFEKGFNEIIKKHWVRPKSLQGIENNNGWIPYIGNSIGYYDLVYTDAGNIYPYAVFVSYDSICCIQKITHYQPIQKPNPPIY